MFKHISFLIISCCLIACSSLPKITHLPQQNKERRLFKLEQQSPKKEVSILSLQFMPEKWRWVQVDPLGVPKSRLILSQNGWENDGFIKPNRQASTLFSAIATYLNLKKPIFNFSEIKTIDSNKNYYIKNKKVWTISITNKGAIISLPDQSKWYIEEIQ